MRPNFRLRKRLSLKRPDPDELAGDFDEHLVIAGLEHVEPEEPPPFWWICLAFNSSACWLWMAFA